MENKQEYSILFNQDLINQLLTHYPEDKHELLLLQIKSMSDFFDKYKPEYIKDLGFRKAVDLMLSEVLSGTFIGLKSENNK